MYQHQQCSESFAINIFSTSWCDNSLFSKCAKRTNKIHRRQSVKRCGIQRCNIERGLFIIRWRSRIDRLHWLSPNRKSNVPLHKGLDQNISLLLIKNYHNWQLNRTKSFDVEYSSIKNFTLSIKSQNKSKNRRAQDFHLIITFQLYSTGEVHFYFRRLIFATTYFLIIMYGSEPCQYSLGEIPL